MSSGEGKSGFCCIPGLDSSKGEPGISKALQRLWMKIQHLEQTKLKEKKLCSSASQTNPDNDADWSMADLQYNLLVLQIQFVRGILRKKLINADPFMKYVKPGQENLLDDAVRIHSKSPTQCATTNCDKLIQTENGFENEVNPHIREKFNNDNDESKIRSTNSKEEANACASKGRPKGLFTLQRNMTQNENFDVSQNRIASDSHGIFQNILKSDETSQYRIDNDYHVPSSGLPMQAEHVAPTLHYRLNLNDVPFILGTSVSNSHSVVANIQNIIAMMKTHNKALCGGGVKRHKQRSVKTINASNSSGKEVDDILKELSEGLHVLNLKQEKLKRKFDVQHTKQWDKFDRQHDLPSRETEVKKPFNVITSNIPSQFQPRFESSVNKNHQSNEKPALMKNVIAEEPHIVPTVKTLPSKMLQSGRRKLMQTLKDFKVQLQEEDITWS